MAASANQRLVDDRQRFAAANEIDGRDAEIFPRSPAATFIGPGEGAEPGAGWGNAVERAVWKATLPSTFCMT